MNQLEEILWPAVILVAVASTVVVGGMFLLGRKKRPRRIGPLKGAGRITMGRSIGRFIATGFCVCLFFGGLALLPSAVPYSFFFGLLLGAFVVRYAIVSRDAMALTIFSTIHSCMRQNLPLCESLEAEAGSRWSRREKVLTGIARRIAEGHSLLEAIRLGYPRCPASALGVLEALLPLHQAPQALEAVNASLLARNRRRSGRLGTFVFPLGVLLVTLMIVGMLGIYVFPKFDEIHKGTCGSPPSDPLGISSVRYLGIFALELSWLLPVLLAAVVYFGLRPRFPQKPYWASRLGDFIKWYLPGVRWFERTQGIAQTAGVLRMSLAGGSTMDQAIEAAARLDLNGCYRRRLDRWLAEVRSGQSVSDSARRCGIGAPIAWALDGQANGDPLGGLGMVETIWQDKRASLAKLTESIAWPCITIALGCVVAAAAYSLFFPMISLLKFTMQGATP